MARSFFHSISRVLLAGIAGIGIGPIVVAQEPGYKSLVVLPSTISLSQFQMEQSVSVRGIRDDGTMTRNLIPGESEALPLEWSVANPEIAELVEDPKLGWRVQGKRDGRTQLQVRYLKPDGSHLQVTSMIECSGIEEVPQWEFVNHVESVLARNGCNMGACHGALAGKGGFRLSLRGYDPQTDHFNLTKQDRGRRVELSDPESSLVLAKPSGLLEHKGGIRFSANSRDYRILQDWISGGAPGARPKDPMLVAIEMLPTAVKLQTGEQDRVAVLAHYSNGRTEDVTDWAKFSSSDESVALVDEYGRIQSVGPGEGTIVAWFASRIVTSRVQIPFANPIASSSKSSSSSKPSSSSESSAPSLESIQQRLGRANEIDEHVANQLFALGIPPSTKSSDVEFLRRSSLDATGVLPTEEQVEQFLSNTSPDKRSQWIDALLESPQFVDYWAYRWSDVMMLNSNLLRTEGVKAYYQWIRSQVEQNRPWDEMVRDIVTARGDAMENGATNFFAINQDPESMTENACIAFLGLSIGCAKCHNHPLEKWTNDQYYAMANMFARVRAKGWGGEVRDGDAGRSVYIVDRGDLIQPLRGKPQPPAPLDAPPIDMDSPEDRRLVLAQWMTSPNNPYFTRAVVNRVWAAYFGVGIVNPVDDLRASNPPSNPALMDSLCQSLVEEKYDLKKLMRRIMNSETYQRSSTPVEGNHADRKYFSHYYPRRLMAEVIHDAIVSVTNVPTEFNKVSFLGGDKRDTKFYPKGTRAIQLYDSSVESNFLKTFGRNQRRITCECERSDEPSIIQVLNLSNGETLNNKLTESGSVIDAWMTRFGDDLPSMIRTAFLRTLSRYPTDDELKKFVDELQSKDVERRIGLEDLLWSLMASKEFLFNH
ncbi:MAG: DUF1553 domain-containing protein [Pirellula sp.]